MIASHPEQNDHPVFCSPSRFLFPACPRSGRPALGRRKWAGPHDDVDAAPLAPLSRLASQRMFLNVPRGTLCSKRCRSTGGGAVRSARTSMLQNVTKCYIS
jgi:hypothetical protein